MCILLTLYPSLYSLLPPSTSITRIQSIYSSPYNLLTKVTKPPLQSIPTIALNHYYQSHLSLQPLHTTSQHYKFSREKVISSDVSKSTVNAVYTSSPDISKTDFTTKYINCNFYTHNYHIQQTRAPLSTPSFTSPTNRNQHQSSHYLTMARPHPSYLQILSTPSKSP